MDYLLVRKKFLTKKKKSTRKFKKIYIDRSTQSIQKADIKNEGEIKNTYLMVSVQ